MTKKYHVALCYECFLDKKPIRFCGNNLDLLTEMIVFVMGYKDKTLIKLDCRVFPVFLEINMEDKQN